MFVVWKLDDLARRLRAQISGASPMLPGEGEFRTDSREVKPGDIFIAIVGANTDGRDFLVDVAEAGASAAIAELGHPLVSNPPLPILVVDNVVEALARLALSYRNEFQGPVVGVTGSVGKSTVKELVAATLSPFGPVLKTDGNRNTEYTAPLMWANPPLSSQGRAVSETNWGGVPGDLQTQASLLGPEIGWKHDSTGAAVVEMGMRGAGQIRHLARFTKPTIAIITNIGVSHLSELGSREAIARAKAEIFEEMAPGGVAILPHPSEGGEGAEGRGYYDLLSSIAKTNGLKVKTFGFPPVQPGQPDPDAAITRYEATSWESCSLSVTINGISYEVMLPNVGRHLALGAAAALLAAEAGGVDLNLAASALGQVKLPPMRMEVIVREGITWVLDMYNAAPASTIAALETVAEVAKGPKYAVLGEMRELGPASEEGHREVGSALARLGFLAAITLDAPSEAQAGSAVPHIGETPLAPGPTRWIIEAALESGMSASNLTHASSFEEVRQWLSTRQAGDTILLKGSRGVELERVVPKWS